jgi:hypothetical protein
VIDDLLLLLCIEDTAGPGAWRAEMRSKSAACVILAAMSGGPAAQAQSGLTCGSVISMDTTLQQDLDLSGCAAAGATVLNLESRVRLDLNGHRITCSELPADSPLTPSYIALEGAGSRISNGQLRGCILRLSGNGRHHVEGLDAFIGDSEVALVVESELNRVSGNTFMGQLAAIVYANRNTFTRNFFLGGPCPGCDRAAILMGERGSYIGNTFIGDNELLLYGSNNRFIENSVSAGFVISMTLAGRANHLEKSNFSLGFDVHGGMHTIKYNNIATDLIGIDVRGPDNFIFQNKIQGAGQPLSPYRTGILIREGSTDNRILRNEANGGTDFDLIDENPNCDRNLWRSNIFRTSNQVCIN